MSTKLDNLEGLKRKLTITIPVETINKEKEKEYKELLKKVQLPGYRKGKVPLSAIKMRFSKDVYGEVLHKLINQTLTEAIKSHKLNPVEMPQVDITQGDQGKAVEFTAAFEVSPEFEVSDTSQLKLEKFKTDISEEDIKEALEKLRQRHSKAEVVERAAKMGDRVKIDYHGVIKKETFPGGSANGAYIDLGQEYMVAGFEEKLVGAKAGDELEFDIKFPKEYEIQEIAGKKAHFTVKIHEVLDVVLPELDDNFAKRLDIPDGLNKLKERLKGSMQQELDRVVKENLKFQIAEQLMALHDIELPNVLVDQEIDTMQKQLKQQFAHMMGDKKLPDVSTDHFEEQAKRKVALGFIFSKLIEKLKIELDQKRVEEKVNEMAAMFGTERETFIRWFSQNENSRREISMSVMEEQVIDKILEGANVTEKAVTYKEVIEWRPPELNDKKLSTRKEKKE